MWEKIASTATAVVTLSEQLRESKEEIRALRQELQQLTTAVYQLRVDLDRIQERESTEREHLAQTLDHRHELIKAQLENILLRSGMQLPAPNQD